MPINTIIGLISALIGSTATLLGAWAYIRSKHPSRKEILSGIAAVTVIMMVILGSAVIVSRVTAAQADTNTKGTPTASSSPTPLFYFPGQAPSGPTPTPGQTPTVTHSPSSTPLSSATPPLASSTPLSSTTLSSTPASQTVPLPSSTPASQSIPVSSTPLSKK